MIFISLIVLKFSKTSTHVLSTLKKKKKEEEDSVGKKKQLRMFSLVFDTLEANFPWMVTQLNGHSLVLQCELIYIHLCSQRKRTE